MVSFSKPQVMYRFKCQNPNCHGHPNESDMANMEDFCDKAPYEIKEIQQFISLLQGCEPQEADE